MNNHLDRESALLEKAIDGQLSGDEWSRFEVLAQRDASQWEQLARGLVDELALRRALAPARASIASAGLPEASEFRGPSARADWFRHPAIGWAAALLVTLGLWWTRAQEVPLTEDLAATAMDAVQQLEPLLQPASSEEAFSHYVRAGREEGRFVQELPRLVLETQPLEGDESAVEVVYVRRLVERTVMNQLVQVGLDDGGELQPVAIPATRLLNQGSY